MFWPILKKIRNVRLNFQKVTVLVDVNLYCGLEIGRPCVLQGAVNVSRVRFVSGSSAVQPSGANVQIILRISICVNNYCGTLMFRKCSICVNFFCNLPGSPWRAGVVDFFLVKSKHSLLISLPVFNFNSLDNFTILDNDRVRIKIILSQPSWFNKFSKTFKKEIENLILPSKGSGWNWVS